MQPNPVLEKLGFAPDTRVVIFHADDVGMCQATIRAYHDLVSFGLVSSASVMVPCGWFPAVGQYCRGNHNGNIDMGVHLTLTCEWDSYRWRPISTADPASGLLDEDGYFHRTTEAVGQAGDPAAVQAEIHAQINRALEAGIDVTHLDTHMGATIHPKYLPLYIGAALEYRLPFMFFRMDEETLRAQGLSDELVSMGLQAIAMLENQGYPLLDHIYQMPLDNTRENRVEQAKAALCALKPGITHFIIHPAAESDELRAICPTDWRSRVGDYEAFTSEALRDFVVEQGIQVIGYRLLKQLLAS